MTTDINTNTSSPDQTRVIFLHHSTGANLIKDGNVRKLLQQQDPSIAFWDHWYDPRKKLSRQMFSSLLQSHIYGLRDAAGRVMPDSFHIPNNNTNPDGLAELFSQTVTDPPENALSHLLEFDVIIFKSCFPVTAISSDEQLYTYQQHYLTIRAVMDKYPHKLFIPMTPPPLRANMTTPEQARRARAFANWMMAEKYHEQRPHVKPYDFFHLLAIPDGHPQSHTLRPTFCRADMLDSHPNPQANATIAQHWTSFIVETIAQSSLAMQVPHHS